MELSMYFKPQIRQATGMLEAALPGAISVGLGDLYQQMLRQVQANTPRGGWKWDPGKRRWKRKNTKEMLVSSWEGEVDNKGFVIGTYFDYAPTLETGGYPGVGKKPYPTDKAGNPKGRFPRTKRMSGGIFSTGIDPPGPMLKPIFEDNTLIEGIMSVIIQELDKGLAERG